MKFLHVSDIHFDPQNDGRATRDLRKKFHEYVQEKNLIGVDEVFFTGDFRHAHHQKNQPEDEVVSKAVGYLRDIASYVGVRDDRHIHIVPGNHDLTREIDNKTSKRILKAIYDNYDSYEGMFKGNTSTGIPSLVYLRNRFGFFEKCASQLGNPIWTDFRDGLIHRIDTNSNSDEYSIMYVNTAIASGHDDYKHKLLLGTNDFEKALDQTDCQLVFILAHNPISHLAPDEQRYVKNMINDKKKTVIWLCGDAHKSQYDNMYDIACITTGCMVQPNGTDASFIVGELKPDHGLTIWAHGYIPDHSNWQYEEALSNRIAGSIPDAVRPRQNNGLPKTCNLPEQNIYFTGREDTLKNMNRFIKDKKIDTLNISQTVSGLGGIGKTQLAIEFAYRYCGRFSNAIWFVIAETSTTAYNHFKLLAEELDLPLPVDHKPEDLQKSIKTWLSDNKDWLLILDNLDSYDVVKSYLPVKINGRLIITTRNTRIDIGQQIDIGVFDHEEALMFLRKRLSKDEKLKMEKYQHSEFDEQAPVLAKRLGYFPLALEQAAAYIKEVKCSITKYLELLGESGLMAFEEKYAAPEYYESIVNSTWQISFKAIAVEGARQLLNLCAYMAPDRIPVSFFVEMREMLPSPLKEDLADLIGKNRVVTELRIYSLTSGDDEYINVHRLVQEVVRKSHTEEENANV